MATIDDIAKAELEVCKESIPEAIANPPIIGSGPFSMRLPLTVGGCPICGKTDHETFKAFGMSTLVCPEVKNRTGCDIIVLGVK